MRRFVNPFELPGRWYKANLHTHTTTSDGQFSPADRVVQYRGAGYDVLALTDHRATNDVRGLSDRKMLVISGMEYHPPCATRPGLYHLVGINVPHGLALRHPDDANRCIAQVKRAGGETILAHPYWTGHMLSDYVGLKGLAAMEVYNTTCDRAGRACSENEWSHGLDRGFVMPAVAVDDAHGGPEADMFEGWTWLKMPSLSVANVLKALRNGACYGSCGPKIHDFRVVGGKVRLRCSPVKTIHFVSTNGSGARRRAKEGKQITTFAIDAGQRAYIRAAVTDAAGRRAWTNPIFLSRM